MQFFYNVPFPSSSIRGKAICIWSNNCEKVNRLARLQGSCDTNPKNIEKLSTKLEASNKVKVKKSG